MFAPRPGIAAPGLEFPGGSIAQSLVWTVLSSIWAGLQSSLSPTPPSSAEEDPAGKGTRGRWAGFLPSWLVDSSTPIAPPPPPTIKEQLVAWIGWVFTFRMTWVLLSLALVVVASIILRSCVEIAASLVQTIAKQLLQVLFVQLVVLPLATELMRWAGLASTAGNPSPSRA